MRIGSDGWPDREATDRFKDRVIPAHESRMLPLDEGEPLGLIWHYDAIHRDVVLAPRLTGRAADPKTGRKADKGASDRNVSWNVQLMRDGTRVWSVPAIRGGRHVGVAKRMIRGKLRSGNRNLFAVEIANAGHLHAVTIDGVRRFFASWKRDKAGKEQKSLGPDPKTEIPRERVYGGHSGIKAQERFTIEQRLSAIELCNALLVRFPSMSVADLQWTHEMFCPPGSKEDPGAAWLVPHLPVILAAVNDPSPSGRAALARVGELIQGLWL